MQKILLKKNSVYIFFVSIRLALRILIKKNIWVMVQMVVLDWCYYLWLDFKYVFCTYHSASVFCDVYVVS